MVFFTLGMIIRTIRRETNIHLAWGTTEN
jgi:hypothetical protein